MAPVAANEMKGEREEEEVETADTRRRTGWGMRSIAQYRQTREIGWMIVGEKVVEEGEGRRMEEEKGGKEGTGAEA